MNKRLLVIAVAAILASCGFAPPQIKEPLDGDVPAVDDHIAVSGSQVLEFEIEKKVYCELKDAVQAGLKVELGRGDDLQHVKPVKGGFLDPKWIAEVSLTLEADESTVISPGATLNTPLPNGLVGANGAAPASSFMQSFGLGIGGNFSQTASTIDKFDPYWTIEFLSLKNHPDSICVNPKNDQILQAYLKENGRSIDTSPFVIQGSLGLTEWLTGSVLAHDLLYSIGNASQIVGSPSGSHPDAITHEIKFIVVTSGNITPTWKLVRVSANAGTTPFFALGRTRTHDLIITIGPNKDETNITHFASQIGNAVSNANAARPMP